MLWTRVASSVLLAPFFLLIVHLETPWFNILAGVIGLFVAFEYMRMTGLIHKNESWKWPALLTIFAPPAAVLILEFAGLKFSVALVVILTSIFFIAARSKGQSETLSGKFIIPYAALPAIALASVMDVGGAVSVYWLVAVVWATDIGAYAVGRLIGGPKLAPSISPNKTWSGAIGGVVAAMTVSTALLLSCGLTATIVLVGLSAVLSAVSQVGDLFESRLKRQYGVKDSGRLIPGHGGVMDRFDGLWATAPVVAAVCVIMGGGVQKW